MGETEIQSRALTEVEVRTMLAQAIDERERVYEENESLRGLVRQCLQMLADAAQHKDGLSKLETVLWRTLVRGRDEIIKAEAAIAARAANGATP